MRISEEVHQAINDGAPVVALESTIVAHGMPRPTNIETALAVEEVIRAHGAVPACVGLIRGEIVCGLTHDELSFLAYSDDVIKAQERDLARACVSGRSGATTVGATLFVASRCGIRVHVTGGIGGVAPDFGETLDISADLLAIGHYPCITVASGTKAFMDVRATLEYLKQTPYRSRRLGRRSIRLWSWRISRASAESPSLPSYCPPSLTSQMGPAWPRMSP